LSVQFGFRYDLMPHVYERNNQVSNFDPSLYQPALAPTFNADGTFASTSAGLVTNSIGTFYLNGIGLAGQNGVPRGLAKQDYKTIMPRVGFSYDLFGNGKTVLRGGFGTFYERIQGNDIYDAAGGAPFISTPKATDVEFTGVTTNWQSGGTASTPTFTQGYNSLSTYYPNPAVAQFSLGVQHEIAPALILITQYVGNIDWHQNTWLPINNFPLSTPLATRQAFANGSLSTVDTQNDVMYPGYGQIRLQENPLTGTYNSFQVGLRQQNKHGLSFEIDYTYAHQIDDSQSSVDVDNNNPSYNPWNLKYDKGSGSLDRRNVLNLNYEYKIPLFAHANGLAHSVLGGWEVSGTVISESGLPWQCCSFRWRGGYRRPGWRLSHPSEPHRQARLHQGEGYGRNRYRLSMGEPGALLAAHRGLERRPESGLRQCRQGRSRRSWPHQLQHRAVQVIRFGRGCSLRASSG
jgi:hypothetical protein